jgi:hypothetical protein
MSSEDGIDESRQRGILSRDKYPILPHEQDVTHDEELADESNVADPQAASLGSRKALWAYLILCFSVRMCLGPNKGKYINK